MTRRPGRALSPFRTGGVDEWGRRVNTLFTGMRPADQVSLLRRESDSGECETVGGAHVVGVATPEGTRVIRSELTRRRLP